MSITKNHFVSCKYDLYVGSEDERELVEQATAEAPLQYIQGTGNMLEAFEAKLEGLNVGDKFDFVLPADQAYGEKRDEYVLTLEKEIFVDDNGQFDSERVQEGYAVPMLDEGGNRLVGLVLEVTDTHVVLDFNHPMAGESLHFIGQVLEEREATEDDEKLMEALLSGDMGSSCGCGDSDSGGGCSGCSGCN